MADRITESREAAARVATTMDRRLTVSEAKVLILALDEARRELAELREAAWALLGDITRCGAQCPAPATGVARGIHLCDEHIAELCDEGEAEALDAARGIRRLTALLDRDTKPEAP